MSVGVHCLTCYTCYKKRGTTSIKRIYEVTKPIMADVREYSEQLPGSESHSYFCLN